MYLPAVVVSITMVLALLAFIRTVNFVGDWLHRRSRRKPVITITPAIVVNERQKMIRWALSR